MIAPLNKPSACGILILRSSTHFLDQHGNPERISFQLVICQPAHVLVSDRRPRAFFPYQSTYETRQPDEWARPSLLSEQPSFHVFRVTGRADLLPTVSYFDSHRDRRGRGIHDAPSPHLKSASCNSQFSGFREKERNYGIFAPDVSDGQRDRTFQLGASCARGRTEPVSLTAREGAVSVAGGEIESFMGTAPRRFIEQNLAANRGCCPPARSLPVNRNLAPA